jgi:amino acid adenylation domain-containing protein
MAALHASRKAIGSGPWQPTYGELNAASNRLARAVLAGGGVAGDRVVLLLRQDGPLPAAMLAVLKAGRTLVVLNPSDPPARLRQVLADAQPSALVTDAANHALAQEIAQTSLRLIRLEDHRDGPDDAPPVTVGADDLAQIIYTSGSTGRPKGVIQTHQNIIRNVLRLSRGMELSCEDRLVLLASPSGGQGVSTVWCALLNGAALCPFPMAERGLGALRQWLTEQQITVYVSSASVLRNLLRTLQGNDRIPSVRLVRVGSEAAYADDVRACRSHFTQGCAVLSTFSSSETGSLCQYRLAPDSPLTDGKLPLGAPAGDVEILLWDEAGREVAPGQVGEIVVRGRYLSPGYWGDPGLTAERFSDGTRPGQMRLFRSGDLARRGTGGELMFMGRKDNRVKVNGNRVDVSEIEEALGRQPGVEAAAVCARPAADGEQRLVAYLVSRRGHQTGPDPLRRALQEAFPAYMVPSNFVFLEAFPLTPHGKIDRQALPAAAGPRGPVGRAERPREIVEKRITWIWQAVLGVAPIGRHDNFFELGGTSLHAVEVLVQIEEAFGAVLPSSSLAEYSTVERLAPLVANHVVLPSANPLVALRDEPGGRPLFLVHSGQGDVTTYGLLARRLPGRPIYGLQCIGMQGEAWPILSVPAMARRYLEEVTGKDPTGPYLLAGTCMGGMVAMEMAQMLVRQGRQVALLGMFDVPHPLPAWREPDWTGRLYGTLRDPVRDAARIVRWSLLRALGLGRRGRWLVAYRRFVANMNALANRHYRPQAYPGTITFFSTIEPYGPGEDPRPPMHRYPRQVRQFTLPGNRAGLFARPVVDELAKHLQACLHEADGV